jgi:hypothetical protein
MKNHEKGAATEEENGQHVLQQAKHKNLLHYRYVNFRAVCQPVIGKREKRR